jgi:hypothetical protein
VEGDSARRDRNSQGTSSVCEYESAPQQEKAVMSPKSHPREGLPKAAVAAFNAIAAGMEPKSSARTLGLLLERGLIGRSVQRAHFCDGLPPNQKYRYSVPYCYHIQWCDWAEDGRARTPRKKIRHRLTVGDDEPSLF